MAAPFICNACIRPIEPDAAGVVAWSPGEGAAVVHAACRSGRGSRAPVEELRKRPVGMLANVLSRPDGRPWSGELPESIRGLIVELFRHEAAVAAEGK